MSSSTVAALYVMADGIYSGRPDVECWDEARDARKYAGPWPVVATPPGFAELLLSIARTARGSIPNFPPLQAVV